MKMKDITKRLREQKMREHLRKLDKSYNYGDKGDCIGFDAVSYYDLYDGGEEHDSGRE